MRPSSQRVDRGVLVLRGRVYVRVFCGKKDFRFGPFENKQDARAFYRKVKSEQALHQFFPERYHKTGSISGVPIFAMKYHRFSTKEERQSWKKAKAVYLRVKDILRELERALQGR